MICTLEIGKFFFNIFKVVYPMEMDLKFQHILMYFLRREDIRQNKIKRFQNLEMNFQNYL